MSDASVKQNATKEKPYSIYFRISSPLRFPVAKSRYAIRFHSHSKDVKRRKIFRSPCHCLRSVYFSFTIVLVKFFGFSFKSNHKKCVARVKGKGKGKSNAQEEDVCGGHSPGPGDSDAAIRRSATQSDDIRHSRSVLLYSEDRSAPSRRRVAKSAETQMICIEIINLVRYSWKSAII